MQYFSPRITALRPCWCLRWPSAALVLCLLAGCSGLLPGRKQKAADTPRVTTTAMDTPKIQFLGTVHVIGNGGRFVLVQSPIAALVTGLVDGQDLVCRASGNVTATLRVSHERRPPFVVADVVTGVPGLGDEVFIESPGHRTPPVPTPPPAPEFRANPPLPAAR